MSAWPERRTRAPLHALLARAGEWLVAPPADVRPPRPEAPPADPDPPRPLVAIVGLAPRAGASTIARAVAVRLAALDPRRSAVLHAADRPRAATATPAAARLTRGLAADGCEARAVGRLCVVPADHPLPPLAGSRPAPLVIDVPHAHPAEGAVALADHVVLVATPDVEAALARAAEESLRRAGASLSTVIARVAGDPPAGPSHALIVPESRLAAHLTLACREPRGTLGEVATELAERSLAEVWR